MSEQHLETAVTAQAQPPAKTTFTAKETVAYLAEKFPLCFFVGKEVKPLKIGLFQDLAQALADDPNISKTLLRQALRTYTMSWHYLAVCQEGAKRVGLQGEDAGVVGAEQAVHAAKTLEESKAAYEQRKAKAQQEKRKAFFKQRQKEADAKAKKQPSGKKRTTPPKAALPKASVESLAALENKFGKAKR